ncbi:MAG: hypothetical protein AAF108_11260 [Planctomycetota bacterium]
MSERADHVSQTVAARARAQKLLDELIDARAASESRLADLNRTDILKRVTGRSAMDTAIESTRRMIETFGRVEDELRGALTDEDRDLIDG